MSKKRPDGEGTLFWDETRKQWRGRLSADEAGRRPWFSGKTQAEALEKKRSLERQRGKGVDHTRQVPTVAAFSVTWLETVHRHKRITTASSYEQMVRLYINPHVGKIRVDRVTPRIIQGWVDTLSDTLSAYTVRNAYLRLHALLRLALRDKLITENPCYEIDLPPLTKENIASLSIDQVRQLLAIDHRQHLLLWMYVVLGLRKGEGLGLKWTDIDGSMVTVQRQVQAILGTVVVSDYTKTGTRTLPIPAAFVERLRVHRVLQEEERTLMGDAWHEAGFIFPTSVGTPMSPSNAWRMVQRMLKRAGLAAIRVHDLRRTCASLLTHAGVQEVVTAAILGHAARTMTRQYIDVSLEQMRVALERIYTLCEQPEGR